MKPKSRAGKTIALVGGIALAASAALFAVLVLLVPSGTDSVEGILVFVMAVATAALITGAVMEQERKAPRPGQGAMRVGGFTLVGAVALFLFAFVVLNFIAGAMFDMDSIGGALGALAYIGPFNDVALSGSLLLSITGVALIVIGYLRRMLAAVEGQRSTANE